MATAPFGLELVLLLLMQLTVGVELIVLQLLPRVLVQVILGLDVVVVVLVVVDLVVVGLVVVERDEDWYGVWFEV